MRALFLALAAVLVVAGSPSRAETPVDLELVLAVDVSRSMDVDELTLQRVGYANAFRHPDVIGAIASGARGRIAVTYLEWAGPAFQVTIVPWTMIGGQADADAFAARIEAGPMVREMGTSISGGLVFANAQFEDSPFAGDRHVVDVSGDGPNNMGLPIVPIRDRIIDRGITINGLPIMLKPSGAGPFGIPNLDVYYEDCVIGGPGAFMITVDDMSRFEIAVRRKLVLEIAGLPPRLMPAAMSTRPPRIDCMIGEKSRGLWYLNR